jgi:hypothetical protein
MKIAVVICDIKGMSVLVVLNINVVYNKNLLYFLVQLYSNWCQN